MFMSFSSKLHVEHNQRGVGGQFWAPLVKSCVIYTCLYTYNNGNNKITELRAILQRESQNS